MSGRKRQNSEHGHMDDYDGQYSGASNSEQYSRGHYNHRNKQHKRPYYGHDDRYGNTEDDDRQRSHQRRQNSCFPRNRGARRGSQGGHHCNQDRATGQAAQQHHQQHGHQYNQHYDQHYGHRGHQQGYYPPADKNVYYFKGMKEVLSNFYPTQLKIFDVVFKSSEAAYQYCKAIYHYSPRHLMERLANADTGLKAKRLAREVKTSPEWDELRADAMRVIVNAKMKQCQDYHTFILSHTEIKFVENTDNEFWARGKDGNGLNMLGKIHMEVRDEWLKDFASKSEEEIQEILDRRYQEFWRKIRTPSASKDNFQHQKERKRKKKKKEKKKYKNETDEYK